MPSLGGWEWVILMFLFVLLLVGVFIGALVSIAKSPTASGTDKAIWILISLIVPILGAILWFAIGKRSTAGASAQV